MCKCKRTASHLQTEILKRRKGNAVFGHRSRKHMRSLTSQGKTVGIHCFESTLLTPLQARTQLMSAANKCSELHLCRQRRHNVEANNKKEETKYKLYRMQYEKIKATERRQR